jgi:hypothetical protein
LICFGLSSHEVEEWLPSWTPKAQRDIDILKSWFPKSRYEDIIVRPVTKSDWNWTTYASRATVRCGLGLLVIREMPIKNFYMRCWITYVYLTFFMSRGIGRGLRDERPIVLYNNHFENKALMNYPDFFWWNLTRQLPRSPPVPDAHLEWRMR